MDLEGWLDRLESIADAGDRLLVSVSLLPRDGGEGRQEPGTAERRLRAIRYDREREVLQVAAGGSAAGPELRFFISRPRRVFIAPGARGRAVVVEGADGSLTLIALRPLPRTREPALRSSRQLLSRRRQPPRRCSAGAPCAPRRAHLASLTRPRAGQGRPH